ncbi:hypothetical protein WJ0W_001342 [Paenibacillus melissococcoides]|uniref:Uncharacterized protein n=1 Tax=Paenibacillus melissococcoides TaxID=2912268 RepID=A0ABN8TZN3_9BACL|nr:MULTISPECIES: hypothetical protein [Paenibacillus]MEB9893354.1 hypothetical protein [Bacillus cereus]CAH8244103.1 hypothetical protein WJ0W_001342 [Paenibacillus melissococcoides]CAH8703858.1 hypothetical protein HTL2_000320 [Paenibacillus melissococcoides]CAH8706446.1 hypothetical protein WDD9_001282 [Paenibacillus melissococcoides]
MPDNFLIELPLEQGRCYALYYEACVGDEVYYRLTFVPEEERGQARFLMDDEWGGQAGALLAEGRQ